MKQLWTGIKSIINIKTSDVSVITKIKDSIGNVASDPVVIANFFNKFFLNVSKNFTKPIPTSKMPHCASWVRKLINQCSFLLLLLLK